MLWISLAYAGSAQTNFDNEGVFPGAVQDGVLLLDGSTSWELEELLELSAELRLRVTDGDAIQVDIGGASWVADYTEGGGVGAERVVIHPPSHRTWVPDAAPTIEPGPDTWDVANTLHCDVIERGGTARLYWTGEMGPGYAYRQIGFATSTDLSTWTEHEANPVLTIDYDLNTVDGVHVHMPTVVEREGAWTMLYSCYQNSVGNRLCRATSADGDVWTPQGVALDFGEDGEFDSGSLRMPEMWVGDDGTWHLLYNGTQPGGHYGPTGYATSPDGVTWTKAGAITDDEDFLQGGGLIRTPYGLEQLYNVSDRLEVATAAVSDPTDWTSRGEALLKSDLPDNWGGGYIQAPTLLVRDATLHMWFNAYGTDAEGTYHERLWHARSVPEAGNWYTLNLTWDGEEVLISWLDDDGLFASQTLPAADVSGITLTSTGAAEVDSANLSWTQRDEGMVDSDPPKDSTPPVDSEPTDTEGSDVVNPPDDEEDCGCTSTPTSRSLPGLALLGLLVWRRRVDGSPETR